MRFRGENTVVLNWLDRRMLGTADRVLQVDEMACVAAVEACYRRQQALAEAPKPPDPGSAVELAIRQEFVDRKFAYLIEMAVRQGMHQMGAPDFLVIEPDYPPPQDGDEEL